MLRRASRPPRLEGRVLDVEHRGERREDVLLDDLLVAELLDAARAVGDVEERVVGDVARGLGPVDGEEVLVVRRRRVHVEARGDEVLEARRRRRVEGRRLARRVAAELGHGGLEERDVRLGAAVDDDLRARLRERVPDLRNKRRVRGKEKRVYQTL